MKSILAALLLAPSVALAQTTGPLPAALAQSIAQPTVRKAPHPPVPTPPEPAWAKQGPAQPGAAFLRTPTTKATP
jgi:hypothetical protein